MSSFDATPDGVVTVPAGDYWLGDPFYALPLKVWGQVVRDGLDASGQDLSVVNASTDGGHPVVAFSTFHGDGIYADEAGRWFPVDSATIGLVPVDAVPDYDGTSPTASIRLSWRVAFDRPTRCRIDPVDPGVLAFGAIRIDTATTSSGGAA